MKLKQIILKNFRAYDKETCINIDDFTTIIGRNDIGKSSILEALDIFFNDSKGSVKIEKSDLNINADDKLIKISCVFTDLPLNIDIDAGNATSLKDEHLLTKNGDLQITKVYDTELSSLKFKTYISAYSPIEPLEIKDLILLKNADLKKLIDKYDLAVGVNKTINSSMRKAIKKYFKTTIKLGDVEIEADKEDCKKILENLKKELPMFTLFRSDRNNSDKEAEIQDPLSVATKEAIKKELEQLKEIQERIKEKVKDVSERTILELKKINQDLADKLNLKLEEPSWEKIFKFSLDDQNEIPINKRGSGVRRLILLSFFKAEVENKRKGLENEKSVIYAIEEPETSQHPNFQKMILESLVEMSQIEGNQILITTHSPNFINCLPIDTVRYLYKNDNAELIVCEGRDEDCAEKLFKDILNDLGLVHNDKVKLIILVEGVSDEDYIKHFSKIYSEQFSNIKDLNTRDDVAFIPVGGGNIKHWAERRYLDKLYKQDAYKFCICDGDESKYAQYCKDILQNHVGESFVLENATIENYIDPYVVIKHPQYNYIKSIVCDIKKDKLGKILAQEIYKKNAPDKNWDDLSQVKKDKKIDTAKRVLRFDILPLIKVEDVEHVSKDSEIKNMLIKISEKL